MSSDTMNRKEPTLELRVSEISAPVSQPGKYMDILCVGRNAAQLEIADSIGKALPLARVTRRVISNGHADPLHGLEKLPDLVVFMQGSEWQRELEEYARRPAEFRPPLVVVGNADNPAALRAAMKASARDFLSETADIREMVQSLRLVLSELLANKREGRGHLVALINAKGGSGASLLASNIAYLSAVALDQKTVFVDLDVQFGAAGQYLDAPPRRGLLEALQMVDDLDEMALDGYMVKHRSGLHVLSTEGHELFLPEEVAADRLAQLLDLLTTSYQQVIVDTPRHIDPLTTILLERADQIAVVAQQYITNIRDATRLLHILAGDLGIDRSIIHVVVNRYQANAEISLKDIEHTLNWPSVIPVPNDFRTVNESLNQSAALYELARRKPITRAVQALSEMLTGVAPAVKPDLLTRIRAWF